MVIDDCQPHRVEHFQERFKLRGVHDSARPSRYLKVRRESFFHQFYRPGGASGLCDVHDTPHSESPHSRNASLTGTRDLPQLVAERVDHRTAKVSVAALERNYFRVIGVALLSIPIRVRLAHVGPRADDPVALRDDRAVLLLAFAEPRQFDGHVDEALSYRHGSAADRIRTGIHWVCSPGHNFSATAAVRPSRFERLLPGSKPGVLPSYTKAPGQGRDLHAHSESHSLASWLLDDLGEEL